MRRYGTRNPTVLAAIDLLQRSIEQPPSLGQAAAALAVSPRQLQRLFATHLGRSFKRFDRELRLERARELLEQTSLSVLTVAVATGFGSVEHFGRSYRVLYGVKTQLNQNSRPLVWVSFFSRYQSKSESGFQWIFLRVMKTVCHLRAASFSLRRSSGNKRPGGLLPFTAPHSRCKLMLGS